MLLGCHQASRKDAEGVLPTGAEPSAGRWEAGSGAGRGGGDVRTANRKEQVPSPIPAPGSAVSYLSPGPIGGSWQRRNGASWALSEWNSPKPLLTLCTPTSCSAHRAASWHCSHLSGIHFLSFQPFPELLKHVGAGHHQLSAAPAQLYLAHLSSTTPGFLPWMDLLPAPGCKAPDLQGTILYEPQKLRQFKTRAHKPCRNWGQC